MLSKRDEEFYKANDLELPESTQHGSVDEIDEKRTRQQQHNWYKQEGNRLYCKCTVGEHTSVIPTDTLFIGMDDFGKPMFRKINMV